MKEYLNKKLGLEHLNAQFGYLPGRYLVFGRAKKH